MAVERLQHAPRSAEKPPTAGMCSCIRITVQTLSLCQTGSARALQDKQWREGRQRLLKRLTETIFRAHNCDIHSMGVCLALQLFTGMLYHVQLLHSLTGTAQHGSLPHSQTLH